MATKKLKLTDVVFDWEVYPRENLCSHTINDMVEWKLSGGTLPPIIVDEKSKRIVDGWHRWKTESRLQGEHGTIEVELRKYKNEQELFLEAARLNTPHGTRLDKFDRARCGHIAERLGISLKKISAALGMTPKKFREFMDTHTAYVKTNGTRVKRTIKRPMIHLQGKDLTPEQQECNEKIGGNTQHYIAFQLNLLLESNSINVDDEKTIDELRKLQVNLKKFLAKI